MRDPTVSKKRRRRVARWLRLGFLVWASFSTLWLANSVRTRGVDTALFRSDAAVNVKDGTKTLEFLPARSNTVPGLIFLCGSGVSAHAYAPLLRPIAEAGYPVFIVKLPYRFAPLESHKESAVARAHNVVTTHTGIAQWVLAGHSLGGALACRVVQSAPTAFAAMVLIGTTHPKEMDLSSVATRVTKVYASNDGVAPRDRILSNKRLLPQDTQWVEIEGGNHSQFGHYGHQLFDGKASISRETQQIQTRSALLEALSKVSNTNFSEQPVQN
jgi:pimeloyl-ACP methyl ester carboxylesterase